MEVCGPKIKLIWSHCIRVYQVWFYWRLLMPYIYIYIYIFILLTAWCLLFSQNMKPKSHKLNSMALNIYKTIFFQTIQLVLHVKKQLYFKQFSLAWIHCLVLFDLYIGSYQVQALWVRIDQEPMAMKGYSIFTKLQHYGETYHQIVSRHVQDTRWRGFTPLQRSSWCILQSQPRGYLSQPMNFSLITLFMFTSENEGYLIIFQNALVTQVHKLPAFVEQWPHTIDYQIILLCCGIIPIFHTQWTLPIRI